MASCCAVVGVEPTKLEFYWNDLVHTCGTDGDGTITKEQFIQYILRGEVLDKNGNFADLNREMAIRHQIHMHGPAGDLFHSLFDLVDTDQSGYMEKPEGLVFLSAIGCAGPEADYYWEDLVRSCDDNTVWATARSKSNDSL